MIARLHEGLVRLISPFASNSDFSIELECPEFPEFDGPVVNRWLESAPFRRKGTVDSDGNIKIDALKPKVIDLRQLNREHFAIHAGELRPATCGPFSLNLNIWDLEPANGKQVGVSNSLRRMIKSRSGVSIYRDGFRVLPYGERDDDWLELNQRRVNNPTLRVSNNQIIGFIEITHDDNPELKDRTSREGLIDTPAFFDLKALGLAVLCLLEAERFNQRHQVTHSRALVEEKQDELLSYLSTIVSSEPGKQQ